VDDHPLIYGMPPGSQLRGVVVSARRDESGATVLTLLEGDALLELVVPFAPDSGWGPESFPVGSEIMLETEQLH
jgi:hypothetical protein